MRRRLLLEWCAITVVAAAVIAGLITGGITDRIDNVLYDVLACQRAPAPSDRILIVAIDDSSVATLGRWPWPRRVHAQMLRRLAAARPAAIAYDVLFTEAGPGDDDAQIGAAMHAAGNVILPVLFEAPGLNGQSIDIVPPVPPIAQAARAIGEVALLPDTDGISRAVPLRLDVKGRAWPHLMEAAYRLANGHPSPMFERLAGQGDLRVHIPFQPGSGAFRTVPFANVLNGEVPPEFLKDRIVLVGTTASGLGDRFRVPTRTGGLISGIEVQANLLNSLLSDRMIAEPGMAARLAISLAPALILLIAFWWLSPARAFGVALALTGLTLAAPVMLFLFAGIWLPPAAALIGLLLIYPLWGWRRLQAVDSAIGQELRAFAAETSLVVPRAPNPEILDPIGGQTVRLRAAIANMRDMRRLVADTIDGVDDPLLVTDLEDRIILANSAACLFDKTIEGKGATSFLSVLGGRTVTLADLPSELATAKGRTYALRRFPLSSHDGTLRGWIFHLGDISDIRRAQREREEMLEFLSHDMRSPQSSIITLIEQHHAAIDPAGLADRIANLARKTLGLADNFVQLARLSVASFDPEEVNLIDLLTEAADELWPVATRRDVRIEIEGSDESCYMLGERDTLARALLNLLDNAVKFSPPAGTVRCSARLIEKHGLECTIEDEGPGIAPERRDALFARFGHRKRANASRLSAGLGLAFVAAAVERHHGRIVCEPVSPHGTRFRLSFPAGPQAS